MPLDEFWLTLKKQAGKYSERPRHSPDAAPDKIDKAIDAVRRLGFSPEDMIRVRSLKRECEAKEIELESHWASIEKAASGSGLQRAADSLAALGILDAKGLSDDCLAVACKVALKMR